MRSEYTQPIRGQKRGKIYYGKTRREYPEAQRWSLGGAVYLWSEGEQQGYLGLYLWAHLHCRQAGAFPEKGAVCLLYVDCRGYIIQQFGGQMVLFCAEKCKDIDCCALPLYAGSLYSTRAGQFFRPAADRGESRGRLAGNRICIPKASQTTGLHNGSRVLDAGAAHLPIRLPSARYAAAVHRISTSQPAHAAGTRNQCQRAMRYRKLCCMQPHPQKGGASFYVGIRAAYRRGVRSEMV